MISSSAFHTEKQGSSPAHPQDGGAILRDGEVMATQESPVFELNDAQEDDEENDSSEDDVHQCGRCKQVFHSLGSYLEHKEKKICKIPSKAKPKAPPPPPPLPPASVATLQSTPSILDSITDASEMPRQDVAQVPMVPKENIFEEAIKNTIFNHLLVYRPNHMEEPMTERHAPLLTEQPKKLDTIEPRALGLVSHVEKTPPITREAAEEKNNPPLVMTINTKKVKEAAEAANAEMNKRGRGRKKKAMSKAEGDFSELMPLKGPQRKRGRPAKATVQMEKDFTSALLPPEHSAKDEFVNCDPQVSTALPTIPCVTSLPNMTSMTPESVPQPSLSVAGPPVSQHAPSTIGGPDIAALTALSSTFSTPREEIKPKGKRGRPAKKALVHKCPICKLEFTNKDGMAEHKAKHSKMFKCRICHESFFTEDKLDKHMEKETHNYPCDCCTKICLSKASLQRHKTTHNDKSHVCDICNRAFKAARDMKSHKISRHSDERNYVCEICHKGFSRREKLKRHSLIHSPNRPAYQCPFKNHVGCDKVFYRKDKLTRHLYSHSKVKPFKCEHCDKSFARTDNLREHLRTHTGVFRYYCTVCGKGQPGPKKFIQHMMKQHNIDTPEVPPPLEESAPEPLVQQHKAVVKAETAARAAKAAASAFKKERIKIPTPGQDGQSAGDQMHVQEDDPTNQVSLSLQHQQQAQISIAPHVTTISSVPLSQFHGVATITSIPALHNVAQPRPTLQADDATGMRDIRTPTGHTATPTSRTPGPQHHQLSHSQHEGVTVIHNELGRHPNPEEVGAIQMEPTDDSVTVEGHQNRVAIQLLPHGGLHPTLQQQYANLLNCDLAAIGEAVVRNQNLIGAVYRNFPPH